MRKICCLNFCNSRKIYEALKSVNGCTYSKVQRKKDAKTKNNKSREGNEAHTLKRNECWLRDTLAGRKGPAARGRLEGWHEGSERLGSSSRRQDGTDKHGKHGTQTRRVLKDAAPFKRTNRNTDKRNKDKDDATR